MNDILAWSWQGNALSAWLLSLGMLAGVIVALLVGRWVGRAPVERDRGAHGQLMTASGRLLDCDGVLCVLCVSVVMAVAVAVTPIPLIRSFA